MFRKHLQPLADSAQRHVVEGQCILVSGFRVRQEQTETIIESWIIDMLERLDDQRTNAHRVFGSPGRRAIRRRIKGLDS